MEAVATSIAAQLLFLRASHCQQVAEHGAPSPLLKHRVPALAGIAFGVLVGVGLVAVAAATMRRAVPAFWRKMDDVA